MNDQYFAFVSLEYTQNDLEYLILNVIRQEILINHSMLEQTFKFIIIV